MVERPFQGGGTGVRAVSIERVCGGGVYVTRVSSEVQGPSSTPPVLVGSYSPRGKTRNERYSGIFMWRGDTSSKSRFFPRLFLGFRSFQSRSRPVSRGKEGIDKK